MTRYEKLTISLPSRAAENARRAVKEGRAESVSAYVVEALDKHATTGSLAELLAEMLEETGGPMTPAEERATRLELGLPVKRTTKKRAPSSKRGRSGTPRSR